MALIALLALIFWQTQIQGKPAYRPPDGSGDEDTFKSRKVCGTVRRAGRVTVVIGGIGQPHIGRANCLRGDCANCQTSASLTPLEAAARGFLGSTQPGAGGHASLATHRASGRPPSWLKISRAVLICARSLRNQNAGAINARLILRRPYRLHPREQVSALLRQQAAAFLLIEKQDRPGRKALPA